MRHDLLRWQWEGYPEFHKTRLTLWIHLFFVPAFVASLVSLVIALCTLQWVSALECALAMAVSFAAQGVAHKREPTAPIPFDGPVDAVTRILAEQLVTFPRFVWSGRWRNALARAS